MDTPLKTERLLLRPLGLRDTPFIHALVNSKGWLRFIGARNVHDIRAAQNYIDTLLKTPHSHYKVLELKENNMPIGVLTLLQRNYLKHPDLGFALLSEFQGQGYAFEACQAFMEHLNTRQEIQELMAISQPDNNKSMGLLKKLGFQRIGQKEVAGERLSIFERNLD